MWLTVPGAVLWAVRTGLCGSQFQAQYCGQSGQGPAVARHLSQEQEWPCLLSSLTQLGALPLKWCCPHSGWVFLLQLNHLRKLHHRQVHMPTWSRQSSLGGSSQETTHCATLALKVAPLLNKGKSLRSASNYSRWLLERPKMIKKKIRGIISFLTFVNTVSGRDTRIIRNTNF